MILVHLFRLLLKETLQNISSLKMITKQKYQVIRELYYLVNNAEHGNSIQASE